MATYLSDVTTIFLRFAVSAVGFSVLLLIAFWIMNTFWSKSGLRTVYIAPFKIVDSSGNLKIAQNALASMTLARLKAIQADQKRAIEITSKPNLVKGIIAADKSGDLSTVIAGLPSSVDDLKLTFQGIDFGGLFNWVASRLRPKEKSVKFVMVYDCKEVICRTDIFGDIQNLGFTKETPISVTANEGGIAESIDLLSYRILQYLMASNTEDTAQRVKLLKLTPSEYREQLISILAVEKMFETGAFGPDLRYHAVEMRTEDGPTQVSS